MFTESEPTTWHAGTHDGCTDNYNHTHPASDNYTGQEAVKLYAYTDAENLHQIIYGLSARVATIQLSDPVIATVGSHEIDAILAALDERGIDSGKDDD